MAGRVRANSAGPRLPFHSYEGQNGHAGMKPIWSIALNPTMGRTELMNLAGQEPARRPNTAGTGLVAPCTRKIPYRSYVVRAPSLARVRLDTSACLHISGLLVPVTRISWQPAPVPEPA